MKIACGIRQNSTRTLDINCQLLSLNCCARRSRAWESLQPALAFIVAMIRNECEFPCAMQRIRTITHRENGSSYDSTVVAFTTPSAHTLARTPNEQSSCNPVKGVMDRTRIAFAALFPVLWLLLCGQGLSAQCVDCSKEISSHQTCTLLSCQHCPPDAVSSQDIPARRAPSRLGKSGNTNTALLSPISRRPTAEHAPLAIRSPRRESPLAVAMCWQFVCRAALDPRAPSSIS